MRLFVLAIVIALLFQPVSAASADDNYFQQDVDYVIHINLDTEARYATGEQTITYTNNSPDTLTEIYLHLYPNAFRSKESEYMQYRSRRYNLTVRNVPGKHRSYMTLNDVMINGTAVTAEVDDTIGRLELPAPLQPGGTLDIRLKFEQKLRKRFGRAGYVGDHYDFAQWYPKVVVYDKNGFHPDKHKAGEFYGEFGSFDVTIDLPSEYVVAATGTVVEGDPGWDYNRPGGTPAAGNGREGSRKTVRFNADNVHDFAWCADPEFVVQDTTWNGIDVRSFYRKRNESAWKNHTLEHTVRALEWLTEKVGPYAYPQVSVVDVPSAYGMEYPMLAMNGRASEGLVLHEVGHIYFYGVLANNERAEPWLDEGFATFLTKWYMNERYGRYGNNRDWNWYQKITPQPDLWEDFRLRVMKLQRRGYGERMGKRAEDFNHSYRAHVYWKAALFLNMLRYAAGDDNFATILNNYYERWKFKHVDEAAFRGVCEEFAGIDLSNEFEQWLHTRKTCDYRLDEVKVTPREDGGFEAAVRVKREGELFAPIEIVFELENGEVRTFRVPGRLRTITQTFELPDRPKRTAVNPRNEILDVDLADNFKPKQRDFQIDWPNNNYYPEWGYQFRHRPGAWYNDVDGLKAGYVLRGAYMDLPPRFRVGVYYGFESERVDFSAMYERPASLFGNKLTLRAEGYKMEGRQFTDLSVRHRRRIKLVEPPTHDFTLGFRYHTLTDARYVPAPDLYDTNTIDLGPYLYYRIQPELDIVSTSFDFGLDVGRKWWGGDYKYERFVTTANFYSRSSRAPIDVRWRIFLGLLGGDTPTQRKFQLAGAGPVEQERYFWLRSAGAIWPELHYHQGGDGNLRGYYEGGFGVNKLLSTSVEAGTRLPLFVLEKITRRLVGPISWYGFFDAGKILDSDNPIQTSDRVTGLVESGVLNWNLMDAGIGFRARKVWPFWDLTLRFDMPLWVNHPSINGETDQTKYRYLFSIYTSF
jgi:hypothetical protein